MKEIPLIAKVGDTFEFLFDFEDEDSPTMDYAGTMVLFQARRRPSDALPIVNKTIAAVVTEAGKMAVFLSIPSAETLLIKAGIYYYDLQFTLPDGRVKTWIYGTMDFTQDGSRV